MIVLKSEYDMKSVDNDGVEIENHDFDEIIFLCH